MVLGTRGTAFVINGRPFCFDTKLAVIFKPILPQNLTINSQSIFTSLQSIPKSSGLFNKARTITRRAKVL